jgi:hypothetical protein
MAYFRRVKRDQPWSVAPWKTLAGHVTALGKACPTLVARSDAEALFRLA